MMTSAMMTSSLRVDVPLRLRSMRSLRCDYVVTTRIEERERERERERDSGGSREKESAGQRERESCLSPEDPSLSLSRVITVKRSFKDLQRLDKKLRSTLSHDNLLMMPLFPPNKSDDQQLHDGFRVYLR